MSNIIQYVNLYFIFTQFPAVNLLNKLFFLLFHSGKKVFSLLSGHGAVARHVHILYALKCHINLKNLIRSYQINSPKFCEIVFFMKLFYLMPISYVSLKTSVCSGKRDKGLVETAILHRRDFVSAPSLLHQVIKRQCGIWLYSRPTDPLNIRTEQVWIENALIGLDNE